MYKTMYKKIDRMSSAFENKDLERVKLFDNVACQQRDIQKIVCGFDCEGAPEVTHKQPKLTSESC